MEKPSATPPRHHVDWGLTSRWCKNPPTSPVAIWEGRATSASRPRQSKAATASPPPSSQTP
eukprot:scaffold340838_cov53-Prasinocladus_malaysianus.AAC.3